jgi:hypothetical protein
MHPERCMEAGDSHIGGDRVVLDPDSFSALRSGGLEELADGGTRYAW